MRRTRCRHEATSPSSSADAVGRARSITRKRPVLDAELGRPGDGGLCRGQRRAIFDPAVSAGAFFQAAKNIEAEIGHLELTGTEVDPEALNQALAGGLEQSDIDGVISLEKLPLPADVIEQLGMTSTRLF